MEKTRTPASGPLIVVVLVIAMLAAYVSAYYLMGTVGSAGAQRLHVYPAQWQAILFTPAAKVESFLLGREVGTAYRY